MLLCVIAIGTFIFAYREYTLKKRTIVIPIVRYEIKEENWYFNLFLNNLGLIPAYAQISSAYLKIGDEIYPTEFNNKSFFVATKENEIHRQIMAPIGHINNKGRRKINGHEYQNNRCEIIIEIKSKAIGEKKYQYHSNFKYQVNVSGDIPVFLLEKEEVKKISKRIAFRN